MGYLLGERLLVPQPCPVCEPEMTCKALAFCHDVALQAAERGGVLNMQGHARGPDCGAACLFPSIEVFTASLLLEEGAATGCTSLPGLRSWQHVWELGCAAVATTACCQLSLPCIP